MVEVLVQLPRVPEGSSTSQKAADVTWSLGYVLKGSFQGLMSSGF